MSVLAIDPGPEQSAYVLLSPSGKPLRFGIVDNEQLLDVIRSEAQRGVTLAIEQVKSYGNIIGDSTLWTVLWTGRFVQAWGDAHPSGNWRLIPRKTVVTELCGNPRAKDKNVRAALIDRYGGDKRTAVGVKVAMGPLYGFKSHLWSALAVGVTYLDQRKETA